MYSHIHTHAHTHTRKHHQTPLLYSALAGERSASVPPCCCVAVSLAVCPLSPLPCMLTVDAPGHSACMRSVLGFVAAGSTTLLSVQQFSSDFSLSLSLSPFPDLTHTLCVSLSLSRQRLSALTARTARHTFTHQCYCAIWPNIGPSPRHTPIDRVLFPLRVALCFLITLSPVVIHPHTSADSYVRAVFSLFRPI